MIYIIIYLKNTYKIIVLELIYATNQIGKKMLLTQSLSFDIPMTIIIINISNTILENIYRHVHSHPSRTSLE